MIDQKAVQRYREDIIFHRLASMLAQILIDEVMTLNDLKESLPQALAIATEKYEYHLDVYINPTRKINSK